MTTLHLSSAAARLARVASGSLALTALVGSWPAAASTATTAPPACIDDARPAMASTAPVTDAALFGAARPVTVLLTHPRAHTLRFYHTLVREHIWDVKNLHLVGIYHAQETEDYHDAQAYIDQHHLDWVTLQTVRCPITVDNMYDADTCRDEFVSLFRQSSGIIFNGGPDIPPSLYHRATHLSTLIESPQRHLFELSLLFHLLGGRQRQQVTPLLANRSDYPVLGICVGMQSMNVANGGTLVQDIPFEIYGIGSVEALAHASQETLHRNPDYLLTPSPEVAAGIFHHIRLTERAPAVLRAKAPAEGAMPQVYSMHHQAVQRLGADYVVTARSQDGKIVEGIHHRSFPNVWGWQFHPERSLLWDKAEIQRQRMGSAIGNFGFATLSADQRSRAFNSEVWALFAHDVAKASHAQAASTLADLPAPACGAPGVADVPPVLVLPEALR